MHEARYYDESAFLTLTYSDEHLPPGGSLDLPAYQRFLKRLRARSAPLRLRHFGCGEYGGQLGRPHYHIIVLGRSFRESRQRWRRSNGEQLYVSDEVRSLWPYGDSYIGSVTLQSAGYVARYCVKKVNGAAAAEHYQGRRPEFMTCSKGIGQRWFDSYASDVFPDDFVVMSGKRMRVPRYYDKQLPEDELELVKQRRLERALKHQDNNTPERLAVRETVAIARSNLLKRDFQE